MRVLESKELLSDAQDVTRRVQAALDVTDLASVRRYGVRLEEGASQIAAFRPSLAGVPALVQVRDRLTALIAAESERRDEVARAAGRFFGVRCYYWLKDWLLQLVGRRRSLGKAVRALSADIALAQGALTKEALHAREQDSRLADVRADLVPYLLAAQVMENDEGQWGAFPDEEAAPGVAALKPMLTRFELTRRRLALAEADRNAAKAQDYIMLAAAANRLSAQSLVVLEAAAGTTGDLTPAARFAEECLNRTIEARRLAASGALSGPVAVEPKARLFASFFS